MTEQIIRDAIYAILFVTVFCGILGVGGFVADCIIPQSPKLEKFLLGLLGLDPAEFTDEEE